MRIILLGPTGSGKGTQAKFISKMLKLKHIEAGKILRNEARKNKFIKKLLNEGKLVPDEHVIEIINKKLTNNFILDGFPRTLKQARALKFMPDLALFLNVNKKNIVKRLLLRKRFDDNKKNIETRYKIYLKKTMPVVDYYKKFKTLKEINGNPSIKIVWKEIKKILIIYQQPL
jgi:adenylate kinase